MAATYESVMEFVNGEIEGMAEAIEFAKNDISGTQEQRFKIAADAIAECAAYAHGVLMFAAKEEIITPEQYEEMTGEMWVEKRMHTAMAYSATRKEGKEG